MNRLSRSRRTVTFEALGDWAVRNVGWPVLATALLGAAFMPSIAKAQVAAEDINEIRFELEARYDSNVARSSVARAALRGLNRSDIRVSPTVNIDIARTMGRLRTSLAGTVAYDFYTKNDQLNRERIALDGGVTTRVGPCTVSGAAGISRRQTDLGDIAFVAGAPLVAVKNTETVQSYSAELGCGSEFGISPFGGISYTRGDNSADIRERADYDATGYQGGLRYVSPTFGQLSIFASRSDTDLSGRRLLGESGKYRNTSYGASFSRNLGTRFEVSAQVAHSSVNVPGTTTGFSGLTWNLQGVALVGTRLRVSASVGREISNNLSSDAVFVVRSPYRLRAMYAVNERWEIDAGAAITRQRFRYAVVPGVTFIQRDRREIYDAGIRYNFARRLSARVAGGFDKRDADDPFFNYRSSFLLASLGFTL